MSATLAVRGGLVVTPDGAREADVLIDGERIAALTGPGEASAAEEIDARGGIVLPGAVDAHVHVGLGYRLMDGGSATSADRYDDASRAAAMGGTTTIIDFAMQVEGEGLLAPLERRLADIEPSAVDVALHCWMLEANREAVAEIPELVARGVPSLKVFLAYSQLGEPMPEEDMLAVWKAMAAAGGIMQAHCESWTIIRPRLEAAMARGATGYDGLRGLAPAGLRVRGRRPRARLRGGERRRDLLRAPLDQRCGRAPPARAHARPRRPRRVLPAPSAARRVALPRRARGRLRDEPAAAQRRASRGALGGAPGRHDRGGRRRSRGVARADQGTRAGIPRGRPRRGGQRPAAAADGRAGRAGRGLRLGARRAPRRPRAPRASSASPTRARSRRASTPTS